MEKRSMGAAFIVVMKELLLLVVLTEDAPMMEAEGANANAVESTARKVRMVESIFCWESIIIIIIVVVVVVVFDEIG